MTRDFPGASLWARGRSGGAASRGAVAVAVLLVEAGVGEDRRVLRLLPVGRVGLVGLAVHAELAVDGVRIRARVGVEVREQMNRVAAGGVAGQKALGAPAGL